MMLNFRRAVNLKFCPPNLQYISENGVLETPVHTTQYNITAVQTTGFRVTKNLNHHLS